MKFQLVILSALLISCLLKENKKESYTRQFEITFDSLYIIQPPVDPDSYYGYSQKDFASLYIAPKGNLIYTSVFTLSIGSKSKMRPNIFFLKIPMDNYFSKLNKINTKVYVVDSLGLSHCDTSGVSFYLYQEKKDTVTFANVPPIPDNDPPEVFIGACKENSFRDFLFNPIWFPLTDTNEHNVIKIIITDSIL